MERRTVSGLFDDRTQAESAIRALMDAGYTRNDISVTMRDRQETREMAEDTGTKAGEAAGAGAVTGTVLGGLGGLLVGAGLLAIPGVGPILAAGELAAVVGSGTAIAGATAAGAGVGAATGGLIGALVGLGIPEEHANVYAEGVRRGGVLVLVHTNDDNRYTHAASILRSNGAIDVDARRNEYQSSGWSRFDENAPEYDLSDRGRMGAGTMGAGMGTGMGAGIGAGVAGAGTMAGTGTSAMDRISGDVDTSRASGAPLDRGGVGAYGADRDRLVVEADDDAARRTGGTMGDAAVGRSSTGVGSGTTERGFVREDDDRAQDSGRTSGSEFVPIDDNDRRS